MLTHSQSEGVSPVVAVILMVAVTVILSATVGVFVLDQQPANPGDTTSGVTISETDTVEVQPVTVDSELTVLYDGTPVHTFQEGDVGDQLRVPAAPGETVTVVSNSDGTETVVSSQTVSESESLIGYWALDENPGATTAADDSGLNYDGGIQSDVETGVSGVGGTTAFRFNGTTSSYVDIPDYSELSGTGASASFWVKCSDGTTKSAISYASSYHHNDFLIYDLADVRLYIGGNHKSSGVNACTGDWTHIVVTWEKDSGEWDVYKNGNLEHTGTVNPGHDIRTDGHLMLAAEQDNIGGGLQSGQMYEGDMDQVRLYNRAITEEEAAVLYEWTVERGS